MSEIALGVTLFTAIVLLLALLILAARSVLVPSGEVEVVVNDRRRIKTAVGRKLLAVLTELGIHLPSACGGVGTCGQCRVRVPSGGGAVLPTERTRISRREAAEGDRLACQVTIREAIRVEVPEEVFGVKQWECTVRSNRNVGSLIKELVLEMPPGETIDFRAGSYVQITCPPYELDFADLDIDAPFRGEWDRHDLWRYRAGTEEPTARAYSMANYPEENDIVMADIRIAIPPPRAPETVPPGIVSSYIFGLGPGDKVAVSGPYGHFFASEGEGELVFVGGGVGMGAMRSHIFDQLKRIGTGRKISFWYGARNRREILYRDAFDRLAAEHANFEWHVVLSEPTAEDAWEGLTGFVHEALYERYLADHLAPEDCEYYLCGPTLMIRATSNMLDSLGVGPENIAYDDFGS
ncbi:MAG: NADH:ubiquinone reductase (Na(+)-transporting) subunit F [Alphaproteobacteria bacterium]|jgi:Na+-transporting NADH:ubiquinone oxidoreductase subunit F|nr:NADH:ubiquinone reductase (Na(+)-transporting) subunit F [Alphaproteobacteria bacterium]